MFANGPIVAMALIKMGLALRRDDPHNRYIEPGSGYRRPEDQMDGHVQRIRIEIKYAV